MNVHTLPVPHFLSVPEVGRICGVSRNTVYNWVKKGVLDAYQTPGRTNLIRPGDLVIFMRNSGMFIPEKLLQLAEKDAMEVGFQPKDASKAAVKSIMITVNTGEKAGGVFDRAVGDQMDVLHASTIFEGLHLLTIHPEAKLMVLTEPLSPLTTEQAIQQAKTLNPGICVLRVSSDEASGADLILPLRVPTARQVITDALKRS